MAELVGGDGDVIPLAIHATRGSIKKALAREFKDTLTESYTSLTEEKAAVGEVKVDAASIRSHKL